MQWYTIFWARPLKTNREAEVILAKLGTFALRVFGIVGGIRRGVV